MDTNTGDFYINPKVTNEPKQTNIIKKILLYLKQRFFCIHKYEAVEHTKWYFHYRCKKCGFENGMGQFKYKK